MVQIGGSNLKWFYGPRTGRSRLEKRLSGSIQDPAGGCTEMVNSGYRVFRLLQFEKPRA